MIEGTVSHTIEIMNELILLIFTFGFLQIILTILRAAVKGF